jgi:membrane protein
MGRKLKSLFKKTLTIWKKDNPLFLGAGISFYVILSLGPIIVLMLFIIGNILPEEKAISGIVKQLESVVGDKPANAIKSLITTATTASENPVTILASIPLVFFGSTMIFFQLKYALNVMFDYHDSKGEGILEIVKKYSFSFLMLLILAGILLLLVIKGPLLNILKDYLNEIITIPWLLFRVVEISFSFGLLVVLFMMIYLILPDRKMGKRASFWGAVVTAVLFTIVQYLVGINAENTSIDNAFGALGYLTIVVLWIFYSALVFLFGAAFTRVLSGENKSG